MLLVTRDKRFHHIHWSAHIGTSLAGLGIGGLGVGGIVLATADRFDRLGVRLGMGVRLGVGMSLGVGVGMSMSGGPLPVHVHVLVAVLRPIRHIAIKLLLEEIVPPLARGVAILLLLISLVKKIFEEGVLLGVNFFLLEQILQPFRIVFLLE